MPDNRTGVIYVAAGPDAYNAELYEVGLGSTLCARRLTLHARISEETAMDEMLIVPNARHLIGDRIEAFRDGRFQAVPSLGRPYAFSPTIAPGGHRLMIDRPSGANNRVHTIMTVDLRSGRRVQVFHTRAWPGELTWGPHRRIAFPLGQHRQRTIIVVSPGGSARRIASTGWTSMIAWFPARFIALSTPLASRESQTPIVDPSGETVAEIEGWSTVTWSPDGAVLLVQRRDGTLGTASGPDREVQILGPSPAGPIHSSSAWLAAPVPEVIPQRTAVPSPG